MGTTFYNAEFDALSRGMIKKIVQIPDFELFMVWSKQYL